MSFKDNFFFCVIVSAIFILCFCSATAKTENTENDNADERQRFGGDAVAPIPFVLFKATKSAHRNPASSSRHSNSIFSMFSRPFSSNNNDNYNSRDEDPSSSSSASCNLQLTDIASQLLASETSRPLRIVVGRGAPGSKTSKVLRQLVDELARVHGSKATTNEFPDTSFADNEQQQQQQQQQQNEPTIFLGSSLLLRYPSSSSSTLLVDLGDDDYVHQSSSSSFSSYSFFASNENHQELLRTCASQALAFLSLVKGTVVVHGENYGVHVHPTRTLLPLDMQARLTEIFRLTVVDAGAGSFLASAISESTASSSSSSSNSVNSENNNRNQEENEQQHSNKHTNLMALFDDEGNVRQSLLNDNDDNSGDGQHHHEQQEQPDQYSGEASSATGDNSDQNDQRNKQKRQDEQFLITNLEQPDSHLVFSMRTEDCNDLSSSSSSASSSPNSNAIPNADGIILLPRELTDSAVCDDAEASFVGAQDNLRDLVDYSASASPPSSEVVVQHQQQQHQERYDSSENQKNNNDNINNDNYLNDGGSTVAIRLCSNTRALRQSFRGNVMAFANYHERACSHQAKLTPSPARRIADFIAHQHETQRRQSPGGHVHLLDSDAALRLLGLLCERAASLGFPRPPSLSAVWDSSVEKVAVTFASSAFVQGLKFYLFEQQNHFLPSMTPHQAVASSSSSASSVRIILQIDQLQQQHQRGGQQQDERQHRRSSGSFAHSPMPRTLEEFQSLRSQLAETTQRNVKKLLFVVALSRSMVLALESKINYESQALYEALMADAERYVVSFVDSCVRLVQGSPTISVLPVPAAKIAAWKDTEARACDAAFADLFVPRLMSLLGSQLAAAQVSLQRQLNDAGELVRLRNAEAIWARIEPHLSAALRLEARQVAEVGQANRPVRSKRQLLALCADVKPRLDPTVRRYLGIAHEQWLANESDYNDMIEGLKLQVDKMCGEADERNSVRVRELLAAFVGEAAKRFDERMMRHPMPMEDVRFEQIIYDEQVEARNHFVQRARDFSDDETFPHRRQLDDDLYIHKKKAITFNTKQWSLVIEPVKKCAFTELLRFYKSTPAYHPVRWLSGYVRSCMDEAVQSCYKLHTSGQLGASARRIPPATVAKVAAYWQAQPEFQRYESEANKTLALFFVCFCAVAFGLWWLFSSSKSYWEEQFGAGRRRGRGNFSNANMNPHTGQPLRRSPTRWTNSRN